MDFHHYFRRKDSLKKQQDFTGYDMYDLIVDKFHVPYDVQINKTVFAGKPVLCLNVMWKWVSAEKSRSQDLSKGPHGVFY